MQQQIVSACEAIDKECQVAHQRIEDIKAEMEQLFHETKGESIPLKSLISFGSNRIDYSRIEADSYISTDNMLQQYKGIVNYKGTPNINTVISYQQDDILISNIRPYLKKNMVGRQRGRMFSGCIGITQIGTYQYILSFYLLFFKKRCFFRLYYVGCKRYENATWKETNNRKLSNNSTTKGRTGFDFEKNGCFRKRVLISAKDNR